MNIVQNLLILEIEHTMKPSIDILNDLKCSTQIRNELLNVQHSNMEWNVQLFVCIEMSIPSNLKSGQTFCLSIRIEIKFNALHLVSKLYAHTIQKKPTLQLTIFHQQVANSKWHVIRPTANEFHSLLYLLCNW